MTATELLMKYAIQEGYSNWHEADEQAKERAALNAINEAITGKGIRPLKSEEDLNKIEIIVSSYYRILPSSLFAKTKRREIVEPRQVVMAISRLETPFSLKQIGFRYNKDHATVLHALRVVCNMFNTDKYFREKFTEIISELFPAEKCARIVKRMHDEK